MDDAVPAGTTIRCCGAFSPHEEKDFVAPGGEFHGGGAAIGCSGISTAGKTAEAVQRSSRAGFSDPVLECLEGRGFAGRFARALRRLAAVATDRRSLRPKRVMAVSEALSQSWDISRSIWLSVLLDVGNRFDL